MKQSILIIEDESGIADTLIYTLSSEGFNTLWADTGTKGRDFLNSEQISFIILDIGLPDINGFELLKQIRMTHEIPVLILTARAEEIDKVVGLEIGADDYVVKPFSPRELSARVKAILRRSENKTNTVGNDTTAPFQIDENKRVISYFSVNLALSRYEYEILKLLAGKPGWVFSRDQIMDHVWVEPEESYDRTVDTHIKTIRAKLKEIKPGIDPIITHRGVGYSLKDTL